MVGAPAWGDVMQLQLAATSIFGKADGEKRPLQEHARWLGAQGVPVENLGRVAGMLMAIFLTGRTC